VPPSVVSIVSHPSYNPTTNDMDVAVLTLTADIDAAYPSITLASVEPATGVTARVIGWGSTSNIEDDPVYPGMPTYLSLLLSCRAQPQ